MGYLTLRAGALVARLNEENQQLVSLEHAGIEYMHGGGKSEANKEEVDRLGWQNSEIVMFPLVGPARNGHVLVDDDSFPMGQHGIVRHLAFTCIEQSEAGAAFSLSHDGGPVRSTNDAAAQYVWPYPFTMVKRYRLEGNRLHCLIEVTNKSATDMPYMLGWHPAFRLVGVGGQVVTIEKEYTLDAVKSASNHGALLLHERTVAYRSSEPNRRTVQLTADFGSTMVWSPGTAPMLCIEPVTQFARFNGTNSSIEMPVLGPQQTITHTATIEIL